MTVIEKASKLKRLASKNVAIFSESMSIGFIKDKAFTFYGGSLGSSIVDGKVD